MSRTEFRERMFSLLRRRPFEPFEIELVDGTRLLVTNPEMVAADGASALYGKPDGSDLRMLNYSNTRRLGRDGKAAAS